MALVTLVKINHSAGLLIADEEFWRRGSRRTQSLDNLQPLLPDDFCEQSGMEVVIGIEGDPSITFEATMQAQRHLRDLISEPAKNSLNEPLKSVRQVADAAIHQIEKVLRKRLNDQLQFMYGFTTDDFNRGHFERDGQKYDIRQEVVRAHALKYSRFDPSLPRLKPLREISAVIAGMDREHGFHWFEWSSDSASLWTGTGNFECIGKGSDAATLALIDIFRRRQLMDRRRGMSFAEAALAILESLESALRINHEVGGYPHIVIIDGEAANHAGRYREFSGHGAKLALEITSAFVHGFIRHEDAIELLTRLIARNEEWTMLEEALFSHVTSSENLEHFLRGYRIQAAGPSKEDAS